jgi:hypothetical protein
MAALLVLWVSARRPRSSPLKPFGHPVWLYDGSMEEWARLKLPLEMAVKKGDGR